MIVHIFSIIPKLSEMAALRIPNVKFKTVVVKDDISKKYEKIVTKEELAQLQDAKVILGDGNLIAQIYQELPNTEWVQCTWAGVESMCRKIKGRDTPNFPVTRMGSHSFSQLMAEYTVGWILNMERGWLEAREYQKESIWAHKDRIATYRSLQDLTVGVFGVGLIGSEVIRSLKFFNCRILGLGRSECCPSGIEVDKYYSTKELSLLLKECDYLVNILPSTIETKEILGGNMLKNAVKCPVFINIGRGDIISEKDIISALDNKWISTAVLDVFQQEPLPKESLLWLHPKVIITPHAAGVSRPEDVVEILLINLDRFLKGEKLLNVVDWDKGY